MGSLKSPENVLVICDILVYKHGPVIFAVQIGCADFREDSKKLAFKFKKKSAMDSWKAKCFEFDTCNSLLETVIWKHLSCLSNSKVNTAGIVKECWAKKNIGILILSIKKSVDFSLFISDIFDVPLKSVPGLSSKEECSECNELKSFLKPFSGTIYGPLCHEKESRFQMLSPMFSKLVVSGVDKFSPTPDRSHSRSVKRFVPRDHEGNLVQTPRSLLFAVLGWSGVAPTVTIEAYDPMARKWFYVSQDGFIKRAYHGVVMLGILIYIVGGFDGRMCFNSVFCFNVENRQWYRRSSLHVPRCYVTALGYRGMVYALGGFDGDERFRSCERFDPRTRKWCYFASMNDRRSDASGAVHKGKIFVCGGFNGTKVLVSTEIYDPEQNQWTIVADMLSPRSGHVLASYKSVLLVIGGYNGEERLRTVERFDDGEEEWQPHASMLNPRSNFAAAIMDDKLHVIAGYNGYNTFSKVEKYDDVNKEWQKARSINKHRSAHGACVFNDAMTVSMCTVTGHITVRTANVEQSSP